MSETNIKPDNRNSTMESKLLYLFTRTPLHIGAGSSVGAIDQPIQRERHTGFPVIPGSSLKGVLRDAACRDSDTQGIAKCVDAIFGKQDDAGRLSFGEAKILVFPVRSAKGSFAFITCPLSLERFLRAYGKDTGIRIPDEPKDMTCLAGDFVSITKGKETGIVLEEYRFNKTSNFPPEIETLLLSLLQDPVWQSGKGRFVLLSNGDFTHFVKNACEVSQHVAISPETGTAKKGALFNLEAVPAESFFFSAITPLARANGDMEKLMEMLERRPIIQLGGDGTTGLGFCSVKLA